MARKPKTPKISKRAVKDAADRAEKRSKGEEIVEPKVPISPVIVSMGTEEEAKAEEKLRGRPTDYDPSYDAIAEEMCMAGATDDQLAERFDVSQRTINRWKVAQPTFRQAIKDAKDVADERVKRCLYHKAMGIEYEELQPIKLKRVTYEDGKRVKEEEYIELVPVKKFMPPDTTAQIFWMKNRKRQDWQDVQKHEHGHPGDFDTMDDDQLADYIAAEQEALLESKRAAKGKPSTKH